MTVKVELKCITPSLGAILVWQSRATHCAKCAAIISLPSFLLTTAFQLISWVYYKFAFDASHSVKNGLKLNSAVNNYFFDNFIDSSFFAVSQDLLLFYGFPCLQRLRVTASAIPPFYLFCVMSLLESFCLFLRIHSPSFSTCSVLWETDLHKVYK